MAAPVQRGKAAIHGVAGTIDVIVYPIAQKLQETQNWDEEAIKDAEGFTVALLARDEHGMLNIGLKYVGDTAAHAALPVTTAGTLGQPFFAPYASVTLSAFTFAGLNAVWQVVTGTSFDAENTKVADGDYKLRRWADATQNTLLNTTPS